MKKSNKIELSNEIPLYTIFGKLFAKYFRSGNKEGVILRSISLKKKLLHLRLQSSCLFSESFKTIDCDCNKQLEESMHLIIEKGGIIIYLYDEGRGAGLMNKFNSIFLQKQKKIDTAVSFRLLGLKKDMRDFKVQVRLLKTLFDLKKTKFILISNNPLKKLKLEKAKVNISKVIPAVFPYNERVKIYLEEKKEALGHDIDI